MVWSAVVVKKMNTVVANLNIEVIKPTIGAIIHDIDLNALNEQTTQQIQQALLDHQVIFFRKQQLAPQAQADLARSFGTLHVHPIYPSIEEGFGIPPLESLAAKIPTICSNTTAMEDFYFLKELQFNPLMEKEIFDKIQLALLDKNWSKRTIEMKEKYNWHQAKLDFIKAINEHKKMER